ncbi:hypothetical protein A5630_23080 [Mycolicibacterium mucogenicum]|uniref:Uncharacterized protein n=1 Tax=Mycolicibacterium mucogenicum TaxID=56689 RepID=A0A1A3H140_MYCMU|nr:hypothetical protein [Mycolicibacterium mucogenicum]OBJ41326.1 hypothetical protein A5630_23080 [Mycolicibacterium mucogenicum]
MSYSLKLIPNKMMNAVVSHEDGVVDHVWDTAKEGSRNVESLIAKQRASTRWVKHDQSTAHEYHSDAVKNPNGIDAHFTLEGPDAVALEFGHEPSGMFAGTPTKAPDGQYILHHAAGLT